MINLKNLEKSAVKTEDFILFPFMVGIGLKAIDKIYKTGKKNEKNKMGYEKYRSPRL